MSRDKLWQDILVGNLLADIIVNSDADNDFDELDDSTGDDVELDTDDYADEDGIDAITENFSEDNSEEYNMNQNSGDTITCSNLAIKELCNSAEDNCAEISFKATVTNHGDDSNITLVLHGLDDEGFEVFNERAYKRIAPGTSRDITAKIFIDDRAGYLSVSSWVLDDEY